jgi:hypothetical protein
MSPKKERKETFLRGRKHKFQLGVILVSHISNKELTSRA